RGSHALSAGHPDVGQCRVADPMETQAQRSGPGKAIADPVEHRVEATVGEAAAIRVVEDAIAPRRPNRRVSLERPEERPGNRDLPPLIELLVQDHRWRRMKVR